jgi:hypothetical protein
LIYNKHRGSSVGRAGDAQGLYRGRESVREGLPTVTAKLMAFTPFKEREEGLKRS